MQTLTFTFSESVENHAGMQVIGNKAESGISVEELKLMEKNLCEMKFVTEWIDLSQLLPAREEKIPAAVLIIRNAISGEGVMDKFMAEATGLNVDKKAFMKGRVVNKLARWNLCIADISQEPDYENKKGRIVNFTSVPILSSVRKNLPLFLGSRKVQNLNAELNYYYDTKVTGIGWHGDSERKVVVGLRLGARMNLKYCWFKEGSPISDEMELWLNGGDMYIMSDKAVGYDWKKRKVATLRHCAGAKKYTEKPAKKPK